MKGRSRGATQVRQHSKRFGNSGKKNCSSIERLVKKTNAGVQDEKPDVHDEEQKVGTDGSGENVSLPSNREKAQVGYNKDRGSER